MGSVVKEPSRSIELTPIGIKIAPGATQDEIREQALQMLYVANMAPLYAADLIILMRDRFGDDAAAELIPAVGKTKHTVQNWLSIARQFPITRRKNGLEMGHYDAVSVIKDKEGKPLTDKQDALIELMASDGPDAVWTVAKARQEANEIRDRAQGKLIEVPDDGKEDDDKPVFDGGDFGEGMSAEREARTSPETDGFDDIERMRKVWSKQTPDLHLRFLRSVMTADLFMQIAPDFEQSKSRVEPQSSLSSAPCDAPSGVIPAAGGTLSPLCAEFSTPGSAHETPADPLVSGSPDAGGGSIQEPEMPGYLKRSVETVR